MRDCGQVAEAWRWLREGGAKAVSWGFCSLQCQEPEIRASLGYKMDARRGELNSTSIQNLLLEALLRGSDPTLLCAHRIERPGMAGRDQHPRGLTPSTSMKPKKNQNCGAFPTHWERIKHNLILLGKF